jgi:hypothetical protein
LTILVAVIYGDIDAMFAHKSVTTVPWKLDFGLNQRFSLFFHLRIPWLLAIALHITHYKFVYFHILLIKNYKISFNRKQNK